MKAAQHLKVRQSLKVKRSKVKGSGSKQSEQTTLKRVRANTPHASQVKNRFCSTRQREPLSERKTNPRCSENARKSGSSLIHNIILTSQIKLKANSEARCQTLSVVTSTPGLVGKVVLSSNWSKKEGRRDEEGGDQTGVTTLTEGRNTGNTELPFLLTQQC